ncbi:unnamed protein product [Euphydryas editha]|uniref:C3H1-type domain-containing protein n=1 Tax=Euphydryas editha TaxID=104508 RepID=A0AAU9U7H3_EUPED|nr:unnamed protein product [Euphydryas editha]
MPPKKVSKTVKKTVQVNTTRRRSKEKKLTQIQTEESKTIKPPKLNSTSFIDEDQNNDRVVTLTKNDINIMLANEVVGRQFPKKSLLSTDPVVLDQLKTTKTKPVLKKKCLLKNKVVSNGESSTRAEKPVKQIKHKLLPRRFRHSSTTVQRSVPPHKQPSTKDKNVENNATTNEGLKTTKPKTIRKKFNRKVATAGPRTRKQASEVSKVAESEVLPENLSPLKENSETIDTNVNENNILLRRHSEASLSELSWTKNISSSSTTTCATVSSKDFFRIDNKIPVIKLTNIDCKLKSEENDNLSDINDNTDKKCPTQTISIQFDNTVSEKSAIEYCDKDKICEDKISVPCNQFVSNLSISSSNSCSDINKSNKSPSTTNKLNHTLEKLSSKLKNFDLEIINWIGYRNEKANHNIEKLQEKLYQDNFLKEEMNVITHCYSIKRILLENEQDLDAESLKTNDKVHTDVDNTVTNATLNESHIINDDKHNSFNTDFQEQNVDYGPIEHSKEKNLVINKTTDEISFADDDEDDALSLYAESITGIESSTKNSKVDCNVDHLNEEYVPQPITNKNTKSSETITYNPTKITEIPLLKSPDIDALGNVCEKQTADSTSIYREQNNYTSFEENNVSCEDNTVNEEPSRNQNSVTKSSLLMESFYKPITGVTSAVYKGICFFNLISKCKKIDCKFPHVFLGVEDVKVKLQSLSDTMFIQEYMLLRCWPSLRWKYGMCFVEECIQRKLTRIAVEIASDFIAKSTKKVKLIDIVETILLYLNNVDLSVCEDLLKIYIQSRAVLLCDFFITTIAESQNFSRFKSVFVNLTEFMYRIGRTFSADVAAHVLERIVILPYDEGLARALIKIIKNTESCIFSNSMLGHLEQQLMKSNVELYEEFCYLKDQVLQNHMIYGNCYSNATYNDMDRSNTNLNHLDKDKRYSPDTTDLDNLNKTTVEPIITRTINLNNLNLLNINGHMSNSSSSESEKKRFTPKKQFKNWRARRSYDNTRHANRNPVMRPPSRPPFKRRSDQVFGGSPSKFQRRNGLQFFKDFS